MHYQADDPLILTRIFEPDVNLVVWQQAYQPAAYVDALLALPWKLNLKAGLPLEGLEHELAEVLPNLPERSDFVDQVAELGEMFACLFDLKHLGVRLQVLDKPMCPRFHVDRAPCRLTATFTGPGTQWLTNEQVNRDFLGVQHPPETEMEGLLYQTGSHIQQLQAGEVGLMKGSLWKGRENLGLVHRSPTMTSGQKRLLLTLDMID